MIVEYFHRETGGVVVGMARWPFDDFTHFPPSVLGAFPGINLPHPLHTAARHGGADTRCNRDGLFCAPSVHQTVLSPQKCLDGRRYVGLRRVRCGYCYRAFWVEKVQ